MCLKNKENWDKNNIIHISGSKSFQQRSAEEVYANDYNITSNDIVINMFLDFVFLSITITIGMVIQITNTKSNNSTCFLILFLDFVLKLCLKFEPWFPKQGSKNWVVLHCNRARELLICREWNSIKTEQNQSIKQR